MCFGRFVLLTMPLTDRLASGRAAVTVADHALVATKLSILRDKAVGLEAFRTNLQELSMLLLMEASCAWPTASHSVETPLKSVAGLSLARSGVLVPIRRGGLGMLDGMLRLLPGALVGHIGIYREEEILRPV